MTLQAHPYAELFPMIEGDAFVQFAADCKGNGIREKIVLLDGMILDGRNRYGAAVLHDLPAAKGDTDSFRDFDPATEGDPLKWVLSKNLARRHLDESQRAMVAARLANMEQGERKLANLPVSTKVDQQEAACRLNVSPRSLRSAKTVQESGSAALVHLVDQGRLAVSQAEKAAKQSPEIQAKIVALAEDGKANVVRTVIKQGERNDREQRLGEKQVALPDKKYGVILADPEHQFKVWSRQTGLDRSPDQHYPTTEFKQLLQRQVHKIAAKDAMLVLWVTDLANGLRLMEAWGFTFKSYRVWVKDIVQVRTDGKSRVFEECGPAGTGYWFRDRDELVLIGTRGDFVAPAPGTQPESVLFAARPCLDGKNRGRHSAKPEAIHQWIEANWPHLPKIELNAREARAGWDVWGNEAPRAEPEDENQDRFEHEFNQDAPQVSADKAREIKELVTDRTPRWQSGQTSEDDELGVPAFDANRDMPGFLRRGKDEAL